MLVFGLDEVNVENIYQLVDKNAKNSSQGTMQVVYQLFCTVLLFMSNVNICSFRVLTSYLKIFKVNVSKTVRNERKYLVL